MIHHNRQISSPEAVQEVADAGSAKLEALSTYILARWVNPSLRDLVFDPEDAVRLSTHFEGRLDDTVRLYPRFNIHFFQTMLSCESLDL